MKKFLTLSLIFSMMVSATSFAYEKSSKGKKQETKNQDISASKGYVGDLPKLEDQFKQYQEEAKPLFEYQDSFNGPDDIKPTPRDNPAFVNIILKKDKSSEYVNDINSILEILEKLETIIEENGNVQVFNAKAFYLDKYVEYIRNKYQNKAESSFISFKELMELNTQVQSIAQLRLESEIYSPYVTAESSGNAFSPNNINNQLEYLMTNLKRTIITLKEVR